MHHWNDDRKLGSKYITKLDKPACLWQKEGFLTDTDFGRLNCFMFVTNLKKEAIKMQNVYYPDQEMHNIYINNILWIVITLTCFNASAASSENLKLVFAKVAKSLKLRSRYS